MTKNKNYNRRSEFLLQTVEGMSLTKKAPDGRGLSKAGALCGLDDGASESVPRHHSRFVDSGGL